MLTLRRIGFALLLIAALCISAMLGMIDARADRAMQARARHDASAKAPVRRQTLAQTTVRPHEIYESGWTQQAPR